MSFFASRKLLFMTLVVVFFSMASSAQTEETSDSLTFKIMPDSVSLDIKEKVKLKVQLLDAEGKIFQMPFVMYMSGDNSRKAVRVTPRTTGEPGGESSVTLEALLPGAYELTIRTVGRRDQRVTGKIPVNVKFPALKRIAFVEPATDVYAGATSRYETAVFDAADLKRAGVMVKMSSSNPEVASIDAFGYLTGHKKGKVTVTAAIDGGISESVQVNIRKSPIASVKLSSPVAEARTGDVIQFTTAVMDKKGKPVADAPVAYSVSGKPADQREPHAAADIGNDGRFVAETPGDYTVVAHSGNYADRKLIRIVPRNIQKDVEVVGHGGTIDEYTSDLWVWEGVDGRDYTVTGTWEAKGHALFYDVTDPASMKLIDTVAVDARTVNDVKISADGRIGVITREGASNRKNGIVVLDVSDPYDVKILSEYTEQLTGGVHNVFIFEDHVYAVNNSVAYDAINISDPSNPYRVSRFELDTPGHGVHDVWIENGIAYSSNWQDGLRLVDVGGFTSDKLFGDLASYNPEIKTVIKAGGSPSNPVEFAHYEYPSGWNHAAFPYYSESTGKFYVLAGDEAFPYGIGSLVEKEPEIAAGWIHFIDFTDLENPKEEARYAVPEAGSHNFWVEDDVLYAAFYNGGVRVVDISGDLKGDLYRQGREIAWHLPMHREGVVANAPMVWAPQPYKDLIYFSDMNSGLWAIKLVDKPEKKTGF